MAYFGRDHHCSNAEDFLAYLNPLSNSRWRTGNYIFRGHADARYSLTPSALRMGGEVSAPSFYGEHDITIDQQVAFEKAVLLKFLEACDHSGLRVPDDSAAVRAALKPIREEGQKPILERYEWPTSDLYQLLAFAQHHGVPTCLLDWSRNPLVAAYFAASTALDQLDDLDETDDSLLAVWVLDTSFKAIDIVEAPGGTSPYLAAQSGLFTLSTVERSYSSDGFYESRLEQETPPGAIDPEPMQCVTLPQSEAAEVLQLLSFIGITGSKLFPGYEGVSKDVKDWAKAIKRSPGPMEESFRYEVLKPE